MVQESVTIEHVDVVVVGAGISGIGAGYHLQDKCPDRSYVILEGRDDLGHGIEHALRHRSGHGCDSGFGYFHFVIWGWLFFWKGIAAMAHLSCDAP